MGSPVAALLCLVFWLCGPTVAIRVPVSYDDTPSACPGPTPSKVVMCYYEGHLALQKLDPCLCSHLVFTSAATINPTNYTLHLTTDVGKTTREVRRRNPELQVLLSVGGVRIPTEVVEALVKSADRRTTFASSVVRNIRDADLNGIEIDFRLDARGGSKQSKAGLVALAKLLREEMGDEKSHRNKRDYSVFEHVDDISTTAWTPPRRYGPRDVRRAKQGTRLAPHRPILRSTRTDTESRAREMLRQRYLALDLQTPKNRLLLLNIPTQPEILVKRFDLKTLTKYVDYFIVPSHNLTDNSEEGFTYHPSRLMGLNDILNTDSLLDLLMGLGAPHDKLIISIPATALRFTLKNAEQNTPRSPITDGKEMITQTELCTLLADGGWTIERDDDLTAPYAFKNDSWIAFDDKISVGIKSKYVLLRDLGGAALYAVDSADWSGSCLEENSTSSKAPQLLHTMYHAFTSLARKSRGVLLETLQQDIRTSSLLTVSGDVHLSPYRVVRVVDTEGAVHVVRKDARIELKCTRPGYFRHPLTCKRFYRCVKFDQDSDEYTIFEYNCPPGLIFEQRWEVCIWPGTSLEDPCFGSSEIAPVPRARYVCPTVEGYYADPENCRWFFACLDHARDGITPLTAYEFRCPFGLVFDEKNLLCQWPWLVDGCGNSGAATGAYFGSIAFGGARRGYIAKAGEGYITGGGTAGTVLSQASDSAFVTAGDLDVRSGIGVTSGAGRTVVQHSAGLATGYEAGYGAGGILLTDANTGSNVLSSTTHAAGANSGNVKYSGTSALGGEFGGQTANSYITGGRSSESFGNAGAYNEGRHISSYASLPDSYVSGGRIENSGGFVSGEYVGVHGIGTGSGVGSAYISDGQAAGISTGSKNAFIGSGGSARALYSSNVAHGNEGVYFSGGDLPSVPDQTVVKTPNAPRLLATALKKPAVAQSPIVHPTAVPLTAHQQRVVGISQTPTVRPSVEKVPIVRPAAVPVAQAVPVTAYRQTVVETPHAPVVQVTTFREAAVAKVPVVQTAVVPLAQTVPATAYQQTVTETPQTPVVQVTHIRRPAVTKVPVIKSAAVPVAEAAPVTSYQETAVPVAPVVSLVQKTVPVTTHVRRPTVSQTVGTAPLATYFQETPVVSALSTGTKFRPVPHQAPTIPLSRPVVPIVNTYLSTPAPTVLPIQPEFSEIGVSGFAIGRGAGEGRPFQGRPAISVATNGAAGISVPNESSNIETFGAVVTENEVPVTAAPVIRTGVSSGGHSFSTTATNVITSDSVQSPASPPTSAILSSNSLPVTPVVRSGSFNGAYSYSTPASAILTGEAVSVTQVPVLKSHVSSGSYSLSTHLPTEKSNAPSSEYSYPSPAPTIVSSGTVSVKPNVGVYSVPSVGTVPGDTVSIINTRVTPAVGYSYPKPSSYFATGKAATFRGVSLASGLEPAVFESSPGLASGLEIPSSTAGPTFVGSDVTRKLYGTKVGATRLTATPASNIDISNIYESGYASSSLTDVPRISISRGHTLNQKALLSSNVEPIHSVSIADGDFRARKPDQGGESVASYPAAEARERFTPQINLTYGAPPVTVYKTDSDFISVTGRAQGRGRPYLGPVSGYVSSTPNPTTPTPGPRIVYSDTPRPSFVSSTSSLASYTAEVIPKFDGAVSTPAPAVTSTLIYPAVPLVGKTYTPVLQSTSSDHQNLEGFGSRLGQSTSRRKPAPTTRINYDNENIEALLDKYSGYASSLLRDVPRISISRGHTLNQKAFLSSNVEPIHSVSIADGDFGARKPDQGGESVASYPAAEARERFTPQINLTYGAPPVTVYKTDSDFISVTGLAQGRGRPYLGPVSGYVSSTPNPTTPTPGPRIVYSDIPRPSFVSSTSSLAAYTAEVIPKFDGAVSTPAPAVTSTLIYPAVPLAGETSTPVLQSTSSDHQNLEGFGSRLGQSTSRRKPAPTTHINYDNENIEALLDKYSGKFGGFLDNNKEGFISGVINGDLVDRDRGRVVQNGRGKASQRGRIDTVGLSGLNGVYSATGYSDRSSSTVSGITAGFSTTPATDIGSSTSGNIEYISTTSSPNAGGFRGKIRYGSNVNTEADGGNGYDAITVGHKDSKLRSKQAPLVFITRLSDVNPLLIAKLGAQCTCKSNTVTLKKPDDFSNDGISGSKLAQISSAIVDDDVTSRSGTYNIPEHIPLAPLPGSNLVTGSSPDIILGLNDEISSTSQSLTPVPISTPRTNEFLKVIGLDEIRVKPAPTVLITTSRPHTKLTGDAYRTAKPVDIRLPVPSTTDVKLRTGPQRATTPPALLDKVSYTIPSATGIRYRARPQEPKVVSTTAVPVAVTGVPDFGRVAVASGGYHESGSLGPGADVVGSARGLGVRTDGSVPGAGSDATARAGIGAGRAFDRYGPGGWRGLDETLQGSVDCQRAGLFRHPKYCNKFYACYWDKWKGRYTLHVFNCPVHLAYDSNLGACNWPSKGPGCSDDDLLV